LRYRHRDEGAVLAPQLTRIMPRYYFDIRDGAALYANKEGLELANRRATEIEAAMSLEGRSMPRRARQKPGATLNVSQRLRPGRTPFKQEALPGGLCIRGAVGGGVSRQPLGLEPFAIVENGLLSLFVFRQFGLRRLERLVGFQHGAAWGWCSLEHLVL